MFLFSVYFFVCQITFDYEEGKEKEFFDPNTRRERTNTKSLKALNKKLSPHVVKVDSEEFFQHLVASLCQCLTAVI